METTSPPSIPLVSGWKDGDPALWCELCEEKWVFPLEDDETASEARRVMYLGIDHLEGVHGRTPPLYD